jgi:hypothetical protein
VSPGPVSDSMGSGEELCCAFCAAPVSRSAVGEADRNPLVEHVLACPEHPLGQKLRRLAATPKTLFVLEQIADERRRQDAKWGQSNHHAATWALILAEQLGQASSALLGANYTDPADRCMNEYRKNLVHLAAVAVASAECLDRYGWQWSGQLKESEVSS